MTKCELCGGKDFLLISTRLREGEGRILRCASCCLVIQDLGWDQQRLKEYYEEEYQQTNSLVTGEAQTPLEQFADRLSTLDPIMEKLRPLLRKNMDIFELGCGCGALLHLLRPYANRRVGVEVHTPFVEFMNANLGIEACADDVTTLHFPEQFDLAVSIGTLDHLHNPLESLRAVYSFLRPGGVLYLEVPNLNDAMARYLPEQSRQDYLTFFWHRAHLFYFSQKTISALLQEVGFEVNITCRHDYTLKNHLNWYFLGRPQPSFLSGTKQYHLYEGDSPFEQGMNAILRDMEPRFKELLADTFTGDALCCVARKQGSAS